MWIIATTPVGQQFVTRQVNNYLARKLDAPFRIGRVTYSLPDWITLTDVYFETPKGDTLLSGRRLYVNLDMLDLLSSKVTLNDVELERIRLNVERTLPDTTFNFQYLLDAFDTGKKATAGDTAAAPLDINLYSIKLNDVRVRYRDDVIGTDVLSFVDSLRVRFDSVDVDRSQYHIADVSGDGLDVRTRVYKGIDTPEPVAKTTRPADTLSLRLGTWTLRRTRWNIRAEEASFETKGEVGYLRMIADYFYLDGQKIGIRSLELANSDIMAALQKRPKIPAAPVSPSASTSSDGWQVRLDKARLTNNRIRYDDFNEPFLRRGIDYSHLDVRGLTLLGEKVVYQPNRIGGQFRQGRFREKNGFVLDRLDADVLYADTLAYLNQLYLKTPRSLLRDQVVLRYDSMAQLSQVDNPRIARRVGVKVSLKQSTLAVSDLLQIAPFLASTPPFAGNPNMTFRANALAVGTMANLSLPAFDMSTLSGTRIRARGRLRNVANPDLLTMELQILDARTRQADVRRLVPAGTLPNNISFPPDIRLSGRVTGQLNDLNLNTQLATTWGRAAFDGNLRGFVDGKQPAYKGTLVLNEFEAGKWIQQPQQVGRISGTAVVDGRGLDLNTMQTAFQLNIREATLNGYRYTGLNTQGQLSGGILTLRGGLDDPNARLTLDTQIDLRQEFPGIRGQVQLTELDLNKLKLYPEPLTIRGQLSLNFISTDPQNPQGTLVARESQVIFNGRTYPIDSLYVSARSDNQGLKIIKAATPFAQVDVSGNYAYTRLYDLIAGEINRYVQLNQLAFKPVASPYFATIRATAVNHPLLQAFVPELTRMDTVRLNVYIDNRLDTTLMADLKTGVIEYDTNLVNGSAIALIGVNNRLSVDGQVNGIRNASLTLGPTQLTASAASNVIDFRVMSKDSVNEDRHGAAGRLAVADRGDTYRLSLSGLLTNYRGWKSDSTGYVQYSSDGLLTQNFRLLSGQQELVANSVEPRPNAPIRVEARRISLTELARIAGQDTSLASGELNGRVLVRDVFDNLVFTGDISVDSLRVMQQPLGNLTAELTNQYGKRIGVQASLKGNYNDVTVNGFYNPSSPNRPMDFRVRLERLDTRSVEAFSFGQLRQSKGYLDGEFALFGTPNSPRLDGQLNFNEVAFNISQLNTTYRVDKETLKFEGQTITFQNFSVRDTLGRVLTTNGTVTLRNLTEAAYNLRVSANRFTVLNAARKDNDYVYGNAAVTANLRIRGSGTSPAIDGTVRLENDSRVTVVLPDDSPALNEARQTVAFIKPGDTLALQKYLVRPKVDTVNRKVSVEELSNSSINLNVEATEASELTIIVDELNGDYLRARGNARLNVGMNASGDISMLGRYEVTQGEYSMTYQVLKRQFEIQRGSYILWTGNPLKATINITAIYKTTAAPADLVAYELSQQLQTDAKQKIPFNVFLKMTDDLSSPKISFDIRLPEDRRFVSNAQVVDAVETKLGQLRQDQSQMNKQVFALLVLNGFISENSSNFFSGAGGGLSTGQVALNSVSKVLSEQLERMASNVLKGVDVDFNLLSYNSYIGSTGGPSARTDLNVGLSKSFMNGRLTVSVGRNFELQNNTSISRNPSELFDNLSLNYRLTKDGRYMLRGFRTNSYQTQAVLQGFVIETGVGFVITIDYNTLQELFRRQGRETGSL